MWSRQHKLTSKEMVKKSLSTSTKKRKRECNEDKTRKTRMQMFDDESGVIEGRTEWSEERNDGESGESGGLHQGGSIEPDAVDKQHKGDCNDSDARQSGDECTRATMEPEQTRDLVTRENENNGLGSEPRVVGNNVIIKFQCKPKKKVTPTLLTNAAIFKKKKTIKRKLTLSTGQLNHSTNLPKHVVNILSKLTLNEEEKEKINNFINNYIHNNYNDEIMFFVNKLQTINLF